MFGRVNNLGCDFNEVLNPIIDRRSKASKIPKKSKAASTTGKCNKKHDLIEIWRYKHKDKIRFTWKRQTSNLASRIDYFLIHTILIAELSSCDIHLAQIGKTTHPAVSLKFKQGRKNMEIQYRKQSLNRQSLKRLIAVQGKRIVND